jgi:hypothetical protein
MPRALPHRLARVPSAWSDVRTRAIMTLGVALVATLVALYAFGILTSVDDLPAWLTGAAVVILVVAAGLAIDLAGRVARAWRGIEPTVTIDAPVWLSGKSRVVHVHHPDVRGLASIEIRLRAGVIVAEDYNETSGDRGGRIRGESRHDAVLASLDGAALSDTAIDVTVQAPVPPAALNAGWSWSIVVACETSGHHRHDYEYPFTVADGGEPGVVTRG